MRGFVIWLGSTLLVLFCAATGVEITYDLASNPGSRPWYLIALWIGCAATLALLVVACLCWAVIVIRRYYRSIEIQDDIRCAVWKLERQVKVTAWFRDNGRSEAYKANCQVHFGDQCISSNEPEIGGSYMGRRSIQSVNPRMIEFLWKEVDILAPAMADVLVEIVPQGWTGARQQKSKVVVATVIDRGIQAEQARQRRDKDGEIAQELVRLVHADIWEGEIAPPEPNQGRVQGSIARGILGPPPEDALASITAEDDGVWCWLFVRNKDEEAKPTLQLRWLETGKTEPPYIVPWREDNIERGDAVARGQTCVANVCELRPSKSRHALVRFYSKASDTGWFEKQIPVGSAVRCRADVLRGSKEAVGAGDFTLIVRALDRIEFVRTPITMATARQEIPKGATQQPVALNLKRRVERMAAFYGAGKELMHLKKEYDSPPSRKTLGGISMSDLAYSQFKEWDTPV